MAIERVCRTFYVKLPYGLKEAHASATGFFEYSIDSWGTLRILGFDETRKVVSEDLYRSHEWVGIKCMFGDVMIEERNVETDAN